jgi:hypothetical protein
MVFAPAGIAQESSIEVIFVPFTAVTTSPSLSPAFSAAPPAATGSRYILFVVQSNGTMKLYRNPLPMLPNPEVTLRR